MAIEKVSSSATSQNYVRLLIPTYLDQVLDEFWSGTMGSEKRIFRPDMRVIFYRSSAAFMGIGTKPQA
jgi:hypothetical protein